MSLSKKLMDRLVCAKYLFLRGAEVISRRGPFASGLAVLHFQDSVEMVLRVIAEYLGCSLKDNAAFNQIIDVIDKMGKKKIPQRTALNQLNKARTNFKHFGLEPTREDTDKFKRDLEEFMPTALKTFLDIDFESVSLSSLVGHKRTENYIDEAEALIVNGKYKDSIASSAIAFAIFKEHYRDHYREYQKISRIDGYNLSDESKIIRWVEDIQIAIEDLQAQLSLLVLGVDLAEYRRFKIYAPSVHLSMAGIVHVTFGGFGMISDPGPDDALFCHRFVIDAILTMKANQLPPVFPTTDIARTFLVIKKCRVVVYPCEDLEIIRDAEPGEVILGRSKTYDKPGYIAIVQDGDSAFVEAFGVKLSDSAT